jgi:protein ImuA
MRESVEQLSALRRRIAGIERHRPAETAVLAAVGHEAIDRQLGGGLARGRLHEVFAADAADASSAAGFAAMLAVRLGGVLVWLRTDEAEGRGGRVHAPGLGEIGIDPGRMLFGVLPDPLALLRAAAEVVRCPEVGVAVIELWRMPRPLDLTASRRLAVAAEASGVTVLLLRVAAEPAPSAAQTRWSVRSAASTPLEADAPGCPAFDVELLRQRGGSSGQRWQMEWDRDRTCFHEGGSAAAPLPGAVVPAAARGSAGA